MFIRTSVLVISTALMLTACSSSSDETSTPAASQSSDSVPALTGTPVSVEVTGEAGSEPVVAITPGDPVTELQVKDVIVGEGDTVQAGATVTAHYVGYGAATGQMFDSSWVRGEPATFPLPNVILGWQEGLVGMQAGGRRLLVVPAEQGYGNNPPPGSGIEAGETLIFVVDLVSSE
ncbi:MAG: FK506-binding protein [Actinomycetota bacterium]|jgi:peptidylprolyl isomerase